LKHLVLDDYTMKTLQPDVQRYIADHYARLAANSAIWVRK